MTRHFHCVDGLLPGRRAIPTAKFQSRNKALTRIVKSHNAGKKVIYNQLISEDD
jgi:hypothetical protein